MKRIIVVTHMQDEGNLFKLDAWKYKGRLHIGIDLFKLSIVVYL